MTPTTSTLTTRRLRLVPLVADDAHEMVAVLDDERMHEFTGGQPLGLDDLRARYGRLAVGHSADSSELWFNWIARLAPSDEAVGVLQATVIPGGASAYVAWEVGVAWQGQGLASEGASRVVEWLIAEGVEEVSAHIHPDHQASARVAERSGLVATSGVVDGEVVWCRRAQPHSSAVPTHLA